jgi:hypothetical protein
MMHAARWVVGQELGDRGVFSKWMKEFDLGVGKLHEHGRDAMGRHVDRV